MTVTALDDHTVRCVLPVPFAPFLRSMSTAIYPRHILQAHVDVGAFAEVWDIDTDPAEVIGTGPFTIARYDPGERMVLRRNPDYWLLDDAGNSLPCLEEIVHDIYIRASQELDADERVMLYRRAQAIAADNLPVVCTAQGERLSAVRNIFGNTTPTLYGLWDIRYLYRTDG